MVVVVSGQEAPAKCHRFRVACRVSLRFMSKHRGWKVHSFQAFLHTRLLVLPPRARAFELESSWLREFGAPSHRRTSATPTALKTQC